MTIRRDRTVKWSRPVPLGVTPGDKVYYSATDGRIIGTQNQLEEVARKMARVKGKAGTINEGAIGDEPVIEDFYDGIESNPTVEATDEEQYDVVANIAQGIVRGDEISHPVEQAIAEKEDLHERAIDVVLTDDVDAQKGDHILEPSDKISKSAKKKADAKLAANPSTSVSTGDKVEKV